MSQNNVVTMPIIDQLVEEGQISQEIADKTFDNLKKGVPVAETPMGQVIYAAAMVADLRNMYIEAVSAATGTEMSVSLADLLDAIDAPQWVTEQLIPVSTGEQVITRKNAKRVGDAVGLACKLWAQSVPANMRYSVSGSFSQTWRSMFPKKQGGEASKPRHHARRNKPQDKL